MAFGGWDPNFLAECAAKVAQAEQIFTDEQLEYLRQYYAVDKYALTNELKAIAKQWNTDDFDFYMTLEDWFFGRRMAEAEMEERQRYEGPIAAA